MTLKMKSQIISPRELQKAADLLLQGQNVAFPTETVYGLGAVISSEKAVQNIFKVKGRPQDNPLIVHIHSVSDVHNLAIDIPKDFYSLTEVFSPGPLTVILKKHAAVPYTISAGLDTVAVRIPSHPIAQKLLKMVSKPLVAPSANLSGKPSATHYQHVLDDFDGQIAAVVSDKPSIIGIESTVVSLLDDQIKILRPGSISKEQIEAVLKKEIFIATLSKDEKVSSPGMKYRHYAPQASIKLFYDEISLINYCDKEPSLKRMVLSNKKALFAKALELSNKSLYANLRLADDLGCDEIVVFCDNEISHNAALMNRLIKASSKI